MNKKAWIIFVTICVVLIGGLVYYSAKNKVDVSGIDASKIQPASEQSGNISDHVFGKPDSKVVFVEYGDYQCPGCGAAYAPVKAAVDKYKGQVSFVFRNFPLVTLHPNAKAAAAAAEAAGLQGKYWQMHDKLYEGQADWENLDSVARVDFFASYANDLGLNANQFKTDLTNPAVTSKIAFDQAVGKKANITQTPTFVLNGQKLDNIYGASGAVDTTKLEDALKTELQKNGITLPKEEK